MSHALKTGRLAIAALLASGVALAQKPAESKPAVSLPAKLIVSAAEPLRVSWTENVPPALGVPTSDAVMSGNCVVLPL